MLFQERVLNRRQTDYERLRKEREERFSQILQSRRQEREVKRKMLFYLKCEEERLEKEREEEEARKHEEAERRKKEEAERKAKLDEIAEKQRQRERELEERERLRREAILGGRSTEGAAKPSDIPAALPVDAATAPAAPAAAPAPGKYVPKHRRQKLENPGQAPQADTERWGGASKAEDRVPPSSDRWRSDDRRPSFGSSGGRSTWSSSRR